MVRCVITGLVGIVMLLGCEGRDDTQKRPGPSGEDFIPVVCVGSIEPGPWPSLEPCQFGGIVSVWINANPVLVADQSRFQYIGPFCRPGSNTVEVRGRLEQAVDLGIYEQAGDGRVLARRILSVGPRQEGDPIEPFDVKLKMRYRLPLFDGTRLDAWESEQIEQEARSTLRGLCDLFERKDWEQAAKRVLAGTQLYRKARGWTEMELRDKEKELASAYASLTDPIRFCAEDQYRYLVGEQAVLVYAVEEGRPCRIIDIPLPENAVDLSIGQLWLAHVRGQWMIWHVWSTP